MVDQSYLHGASAVRKPRTCITPSMLAVLQRAFDLHSGHPSSDVRQDLAMQLGMTPKSVQVWFQNRRQKMRGQQNAVAQSAAIIAAVANGHSQSGRAASPDSPDTSDTDTRDWARFSPPRARAPVPPPLHVPSLPPPQLPLPDEESAKEASAAAVAPSVPRLAAGLSAGGFPALPAWLLNELASVASAEQDLAVFARSLMERKMDLLEKIKRFEEQAGMAQHVAAAAVAAALPLPLPAAPDYKQAAAAIKHTLMEAHDERCASPAATVELADTEPPPCRDDALAGLLSMAAAPAMPRITAVA